MPIIIPKDLPAYQALIDEHGFTQDEISKTVGKSRPAVTNALRLLNLPENPTQRAHKGHAQNQSYIHRKNTRQPNTKPPHKARYPDKDGKNRSRPKPLLHCVPKDAKPVLFENAYKEDTGFS